MMRCSAFHILLCLTLLGSVAAGAVLKKTRPAWMSTWNPGDPCPMEAFRCHNAEAMKYLSKLRQTAGVKPYKFASLAMTKDAYDHSKKMAEAGKQMHTNLDAVNSADKYECGEFLVAELVAVHLYKDGKSVADQCLDPWKRSAPHLNAINFGRLDEAALGAYVNGTKLWCTLLLAVNTDHKCVKPVWPPPSTTPSMTPSSSVTPSPTPTLSVSASSTPSASASPSSTPSSSASPSSTPSLSVSPSSTPSLSSSPSETPSNSVSPSASLSMGASPSATPTSSVTPTLTPSPTMTAIATLTPSPTTTTIATPTVTPSRSTESDGRLATTAFGTTSTPSPTASISILVFDPSPTSTSTSNATLGQEIGSFPFMVPSPVFLSPETYQFSYGRVNIRYPGGLEELVTLQCFGGVCRYCTATGDRCYSGSFSILIDMYLKKQKKSTVTGGAENG